MDVKITTTVGVSNAIGEGMASVTLTKQISIGGNPRMFIGSVNEAAQDITEHAVVTAALGLDRANASQVQV